MENGTIIKWNDEKGYGFISSENGKREVFLHISAFSSKRRRPIIGDKVCFDPIIENSGKLKAKFASFIEKNTEIETNTRPIYRSDRRPSLSPYRSFRKFSGKIMLIAIIPAAILYSCFAKSNGGSVDKVIAPQSEKKAYERDHISPSKTYTCNGKRNCSQMDSKEEAQFYLQNCPNDGMDGDNDGVACEQKFGY